MTNGKVPAVKSDRATIVQYTVRQGDNLTKISKATGISIDDLQKDNDIQDPNLIYADSKLKLKVYEYEILDLNTGEKEPDMMRNIGNQTRIKKYEEINNQGVSVWLRNNNDN